jgi:NTP pyrophosphatase (non-canonical NTP hydrolase)
MKLKEYEKIIAETAIYPKEINVSFGLAYCMLGLNEEFQEYLDATTPSARKKETGDVIWYVTAMATEVNTTISELWLETATESLNITAFSPTDIQKMITRLNGNVKKYYRDGKDYTPQIKTVLKYVLCYLAVTVNGYTFSDVLATNYEKLIKRRETNTLHGEGDNREEI